MALQDDIKKAIEDHGVDIMKTVALPNILADISEEYNGNSALKNIFKDFFNEGNGQKVLDLQAADKEERELKLKQIGDSFAKKNGYAFSIVNYIISCISYAMGWSDFITESTPQPANDLPDKISGSPINLQNALTELKLEYTNQISALYTKPAYKLFYIQPGYFSAEALSTLRLTENKIKIVSQALGFNQDDWCQQQLQSFIIANKIKTYANRNRIITRIVIPCAIILVVGFGIWSSIVSDNNVDAYNAEYQKVEQLVSAQDYDKAITSIGELNQKYSSSYGVTSAIIESNAKAKELMDAYVSQSVAVGHYDDAISWLQSKQPQFANDATVSDYISEKAASLTQEKQTLIETGLPDLLSNIQSNNGHLNDEGKSLLRKLLNIDPDNYWIKFIASKEL